MSRARLARVTATGCPVTVASAFKPRSNRLLSATTNRADPDDRRATITGYAEHFAELRGRQFRGAGKTLHYVGTMFPRASRTRSRRMTASSFVKGPVFTGPDGQPTNATPIPDELKLQFVDAFWHSMAWRETTWLGRRVERVGAQAEVACDTDPTRHSRPRFGRPGRVLP